MVRPSAFLFCLASLLWLARARAGEAEDAMCAKAVEWLIGQQHGNGGFSQIPGEGEGELGITCLVVRSLAETPPAVREKAAQALEKGTAFILQHRQKDGSFVQGRSGLATYRTSMAILALSAVDRAKHADVIASAAKWLTSGQADEGEEIQPSDVRYGGFTYGPAGGEGRGQRGGRGGGPGADLSNTHLALAALREAGVQSDDPVFQRALKFISRCQNSSETNDGAGVAPADDGGFLYDPVPRSPEDKDKPQPSYAGMTYAGLISLVLSGVSQDDPRVQAAWRWIGANYTLEENKGLGVRGTPSQAGLYYYYYTFAKCLNAIGQPTVETEAGQRPWARDLCAALKARQKEDGSFVNSDGQWWERDPVLVTAYCIGAMNWARPYLPQ